MKHPDDIKKLLASFPKKPDQAWEFDEEAIIAAYQRDETEQSLMPKVLSVFGGILASLSFLLFLAFFALPSLQSGLLVLGLIFIAGSVFANNIYDTIVIDTVCASFFLSGFLIFAIASVQLDILSTTSAELASIFMALVALLTSRKYVLPFLAVWVMNVSTLMLIMTDSTSQALLHLYASFLALSLTYLSLHEARILRGNKVLARIYSPLNMGLFFAFLSALVLLTKTELLLLELDLTGLSSGILTPDDKWISSGLIILSILYLISKLFSVLEIKRRQDQIGIFILVLLGLLPTVLSPAISGAMLIILLSFMTHQKTAFAMGIISFVYFIAQYYYDLSFTLLDKSMLLFSTGLVFIALFAFTYKKWTGHEKI